MGISTEGQSGHARVATTIRDEARQFEVLIRSVTDYAIYMLDPEGYIQTWNPGGERIKGYAAEEVIGTHFSRFYTPEDRASDLPMRALAIAREEDRFTAEGARVRKDGSIFHASVVIDPIWVDGELIGYAKITRDVTERFESQKQLAETQAALLHAQKMEAIGNITLGLAHDFNNLLMVVINSLDLISTKAGDDPLMSKWVRSALRASERGTLLTRQLLTFGRGQALSPERTDVNAQIMDGLELYQRSAGSIIRLQTDLANDLPDVEVDRTQFDAAVMNLVCNSRDAMPLGGEIMIATSPRTVRNPTDPSGQERLYVAIEVKDSGEGMTPEVQKRVFDPFFTTKEVGKGSGLGLSQVFGLASQSGGFVNLASEPGRGTSLTIFLPAVRN